MRRLVLALILVAVLPGCKGRGTIEHSADGHAVDIAAQADRKARDDAAQAMEQRSLQVRSKDPAQADRLEDQARAMRDHNKAAAYSG
ncbi:hypothetical protein [Flavisphingomonas formosensis]|uniref:hypothetical protein n=1 Tax=Flavisphingomonas formosensis TaxID=861534 RepID=UPI0018DF506B|nr:hypothetical protein [Sphingomonas formosensis]